MSKANEPVHPVLYASEWTDRETDPNSVTEWSPHGGLNKREYFAGLALNAWVMKSGASVPDLMKDAPFYKHIAVGAVNVADALIAELEKGSK